MNSDPNWTHPAAFNTREKRDFGPSTWTFGDIFSMNPLVTSWSNRRNGYRTPQQRYRDRAKAERRARAAQRRVSRRVATKDTNSAETRPLCEPFEPFPARPDTGIAGPKSVPKANNESPQGTRRSSCFNPRRLFACRRRRRKVLKRQATPPSRQTGLFEQPTPSTLDVHVPRSGDVVAMKAESPPEGQPLRVKSPTTSYAEQIKETAYRRRLHELFGKRGSKDGKEAPVKAPKKKVD